VQSAVQRTMIGQYIDRCIYDFGEHCHLRYCVNPPDIMSYAIKFRDGVSKATVFNDTRPEYFADLMMLDEKVLLAQNSLYARAVLPVRHLQSEMDAFLANLQQMYDGSDSASEVDNGDSSDGSGSDGSTGGGTGESKHGDNGDNSNNSDSDDSAGGGDSDDSAGGGTEESKHGSTEPMQVIGADEVEEQTRLRTLNTGKLADVLDCSHAVHANPLSVLICSAC